MNCIANNSDSINDRDSRVRLAPPATSLLTGADPASRLTSRNSSWLSSCSIPLTALASWRPTLRSSSVSTLREITAVRAVESTSTTATSRAVKDATKRVLMEERTPVHSQDASAR